MLSLLRWTDLASLPPRDDARPTEDYQLYFTPDSLFLNLAGSISVILMKNTRVSGETSFIPFFVYH